MSKEKAIIIIHEADVNVISCHTGEILAELRDVHIEISAEFFTIYFLDISGVVAFENKRIKAISEERNARTNYRTHRIDLTVE